MASNVQKKKLSLLRQAWNNVQHTRKGRGASTAISSSSHAGPLAATGSDSALSAANITSTLPKEPHPQQKFGLFLLTTDSGDDQLDPQVPDIVAIHGINGDLYETWTHENGCFWLRDLLPRHFTKARVFSFGYDAQVAFTTSTADLRSFAQSLLGHLGRYRTGNVSLGLFYIILHSASKYAISSLIIPANLRERNNRQGL